MTEETLCTEFALLYPELAVYTRKALWALHSRLELNDVLSECYLYCHSARHQVSETTPLEAIAKNWIRQNIIWYNSPLKRLSVSDAPTPRDSPIPPDIDPEECLAAWVKGLSQYERRLWDLWYTMGLRRGKEVSGYLDISLSSAYLVLKECRALEARLHSYINKNF